MKKLILASIIGIALFSCNNSDETNNTIDPEPETHNYFPQNLDNNWKYVPIEDDTIVTKFNGTTSINGQTYNKLIHPETIFGRAGTANVRKSGNEYFVSGTIELSENPEFPSITVENLKFLDEAASVGDLISSNQYTVELESSTYQQGGISATVTPNIDIKVEIHLDEHYDTNDIIGYETYTDVVRSRWDYYLQVRLVFSDTGAYQIPQHILVPESAVGALQQYFASDIGVARSVVYVNLSDLEFNTVINIAGQQVDISDALQEYINFIDSQTYYQQVYKLSSYNVY